MSLEYHIHYDYVKYRWILEHRTHPILETANKFLSSTEHCIRPPIANSNSVVIKSSIFLIILLTCGMIAMIYLCL